MFLLTEGGALENAEAVLFVDDDEGEVVEFDDLGEEGLCADDKVDSALGDLGEDFTALGGGGGGSAEGDFDVGACEPALGASDKLVG